MHPITYIVPKSNKSGSISVDIVVSWGSEERKFFGIQRGTSDIYCFQYYHGKTRGSYHVSRHGSGIAHRKLEGKAPFYLIRDGQLVTPVPMPFQISIREPQKPPISSIRGIEPLRLFERAEGFFTPEEVFQWSATGSSKATYQFCVELQRFAGRLLSFRIFLMELDKGNLLDAYLDQLQERGSSEPVAQIAVSRVDVLTTRDGPWLGVALLTCIGNSVL